MANPQRIHAPPPENEPIWIVPAVGGKGPFAAYVPPPPKHVLLTETDGGNAAIVKLGRGAATVTEGYGGWVLQERPKDVALTEWVGGVPPQVTIPFTIGSKRRPRGSQTEQMCRRLERLAGLGGKREPPRLVVHGNGAVPHDYTKLPGWRWVIEDLGWDEGEESRGSRGRRVWVVGTLIIRHYTRDRTLAGLSPAVEQNREERDPQERGELRGRRYITRQGDTLRKIGKRFGLVHAEMQEFKQINNIRDLDKVLDAGKTIMLPKRSAEFG